MYRKIKDRELKQDITLGYVYFIDIDHPLASNSSVPKVYHHRHVASLKIGRWLESHEHVHHIDENKANNDPDNLEIMSHADHARLHTGSKKIQNTCTVCFVNFETTETKQRVYCSAGCFQKSQERIKWPDYNTLTKMVEDSNFSAVGRQLGVSDNAVRKRLQNHAPCSRKKSSKLPLSSGGQA